MKKHILALIFLLACALPTLAQTGVQYQGTVNTKVINRGLTGADSGLVITPSDTFNKSLPVGTIRFLTDLSGYVFTGSYWKYINAPNLTPYMRYVDSANMLVPYARKSLVNDTAAALRSAIAAIPTFDTGVLNLETRLGGKQNSLGFTPYNATNPAGYISSVPAQSFSSLTGKPTTLSGYGITDAYPLSGNPSGFLTSYSESDPTFDTKFAAKSTSDLAEGTNKYYTDAKVQAVIDADTGRGVGNLATGGSLKKVSDSLGALIGGGGVSVASAAELNTGTDNAKFASALAIEGSKYLDQDGSKIYAVTTGTATAYVLATTPSFTPATGTVLNVKFHLANTGAATINVNGSGAVALQKDLSTALVANDIPINSEYQLLRTATGWLIKDIGFAGLNTSARFFASISDETGGTLVVGSASPTFTGTPAAPTAAAGTNTTQIATTAHVFAERTNTATLTNKTLTSPSIATPLVTGLSSGTTNDSLLVADPSTGAVRRISSARIGGGGGSGWGLTGNAGTTAGTNFIGTTDNVDVVFKRSNNEVGRFYDASVSLGRAITSFDGQNTLIGFNNATYGVRSTFLGTLNAASGGSDRTIGVGNSIALNLSRNLGIGWDINVNHANSGVINLTSTAVSSDVANQLKIITGGSLATEQYRLTDLNTAPSSSTDTGVKGEIRVTATYIYICTATNTWVRTALSTF